MFLALSKSNNTPISDKIPFPNQMLFGKNLKGVLRDFSVKKDNTVLKEEIKYQLKKKTRKTKTLP